MTVLTTFPPAPYHHGRITTSGGKDCYIVAPGPFPPSSLPPSYRPFFEVVMEVVRRRNPCFSLYSYHLYSKEKRNRGMKKAQEYARVRKVVREAHHAR